MHHTPPRPDLFIDEYIVDHQLLSSWRIGSFCNARHVGAAASVVPTTFLAQICFREGTAPRPPNGLRFTRAALIDRDGSRAKATFQKSSDLARRIAASGASACW